MKKSIKNTVNKILLLLSFALVSVPALADAGEGTSEGIDYSLLVRTPEFWMAIVLFFGFITAALMLGREKKETGMQ